MATCSFGLEKVVFDELKKLGIWIEHKKDGHVFFSGEMDAMYRANLWLRTADKVFLVLKQTKGIDTFEKLFEAVYELPWSDLLRREGTFPVLVKSKKSKLTSTPACQSIVKKAVVKKLQTVYPDITFPESGEEMVIQCWLENDELIVGINTSGEGLHRRGYRQNALHTQTPMRENLAAALVYLSGWQKELPLYDPFCGTGTILLEAAMIAYNIAPGLGRFFAFEKWKMCDKDEWDKVRKVALESRDETTKVTLVGSDKSHEQISLALENILALDIPSIKLFDQDVRKVSLEGVGFKPTSTIESGMVITNPPYGIKSDAKDLDEIYQALARRYQAWKGVSWHILTAYEKIETVFGQEAKKRRKLYNGGIKCYLYSF